MRFKCIKCGLCCQLTDGYRPLSFSDIRRISAFLEVDTKCFLETHCYILNIEFKINNEQYIHREICIKDNNGKCVFYKENLCQIHTVKPLDCKSYPYIGNLQYMKKISRNNTYCKGFEYGRTIKETQLSKLFDKYKRNYMKNNAEFIENEFEIANIFPEINMITICKNDTSEIFSF